MTGDYWSLAGKQASQTLLGCSAKLSLDALNGKNEYTVSSYCLHPSGVSLALGFAFENLALINQSAFVVGLNLFHKSNVPLQPNWSLSVPSSVTCLAFHPKKTSILAVGMANGMIAIYDIAKSEELLLLQSEINLYFHIDRVTSLEWCAFKVNKAMKLVGGSNGRCSSAARWTPRCLCGTSPTS